MYRIKNPRRLTNEEKRYYSVLDKMTAQQYEQMVHALIDSKNGGT